MILLLILSLILSDAIYYIIYDVSQARSAGHDRLRPPPWTRLTSGFLCLAFVVVEDIVVDSPPHFVVVVVEDIVVDSPPKSFHPI